MKRPEELEGGNGCSPIPLGEMLKPTALEDLHNLAKILKRAEAAEALEMEKKKKDKG